MIENEKFAGDIQSASAEFIVESLSPAQWVKVQEMVHSQDGGAVKPNPPIVPGTADMGTISECLIFIGKAILYGADIMRSRR